MGFLDNLFLRKKRKEKDEKIAQAQQLIEVGNFEKAEEVLVNIEINDYAYDHDAEYREDDIEQLYQKCKTGMEERNAREKAEREAARQAAKDRIIDKIKAALNAKDWREAIRLLDEAEDTCDHSHRSFDMEELCIAAQEMCFNSDEMNDWSDVIFSKLYMRKKEDYINLAKKMVDKNNLSVARDTLFLLDRKYNSAYMDDVVEELWNTVMNGKVRQKDIFAEEPAADEALKAAQKEEALSRLVTLVKEGYINSNVYRQFAKDILCGSMLADGGAPYIKELDKNDDLYLLAKSHEEELGCMVYHAVDAGRTAYLLTVHKEKDRWEEEGLKTDTIEALIYSLDEEDYHYDYVTVYNNSGALGIVEKPEDLPEEDSETAKCEEENPDTAEEVLPKIDGKDGEQWHKEAVKYYHDKQYTPALICMENAAKLGVVSAMHDTAVMYHMGLGTQADAQKYIYWHQKAAEAGYHKSMYYLSHRYYTGEGVEKDHAKAFYWAEKAVEDDTPEHWFNLAHKYDNCEGVEKDTEKYFYALEKAAQGGIKEAFTHCAYCYDFGCGVAQDKAKALYWYEKAAEAGEAEAMMVCYRRYMEGVGTEIDYDKASHWLAEACNAGDASALYELGKMHLDSGENEDELNKGYALLEQAGEKGHVDAMIRLADDYGKNNEDAKVEQDLKKAFYWYEKAANAGNSHGMLYTFYSYFNAVGTEQNQEKAIKWLWASIDAGEMDGAVFMSDVSIKAAEQTGDKQYYETALQWAEIAANGGNEKAKVNLTKLYLSCFQYEYEKEQPDLEKIIKYADGLIETDYFHNHLEQAYQARYIVGVAACLQKHPDAEKYGEHFARYAEMAALLGDAKSMHVMGSLYFSGKYVKKDMEKAFFWCKKAADNGDNTIYSTLAKMYYYGEGCEKDYEKAFTFATLAAENGSKDISYTLASLYYYGEGCEENNEKAFELYQEAAAEDFAPAYYQLGEMYENGLGCEIDRSKALEMYKKALAGGVKEAEEKVKFYTT